MEIAMNFFNYKYFSLDKQLATPFLELFASGDHAGEQQL
jgi:hypothetical protein